MVFRLIHSLSSTTVWPRPEVDIGGREVIQALVVAPVVVMLDEGAELYFEIAGQTIVLQQVLFGTQVQRRSACYQLRFLKSRGQFSTPNNSRGRKQNFGP